MKDFEQQADELMKEGLMEMESDWNKLLGQVKSKTDMPSENVISMFKKCFEVGWSAGSKFSLEQLMRNMMKKRI